MSALAQDVGRVAGMADMSVAALPSRTVEDSAGIAYGLPVKQGTNDGGCTAGIGSTDFAGFTVATQLSKTAYAQGDVACLMRKGSIWLTAGGTINAGDKVMVSAAGVLKTDAKGSTSYYTLTEATASTSAANGELFKLRMWGTTLKQQTVT